MAGVNKLVVPLAASFDYDEGSIRHAVLREE
jgi:hypothetical protein